MRWWLWAAAAVLVGCGPAPLPAPKVLSIEPDQMISSGTANITVVVDAVLPFTADYGQSQVSVSRSVVLGIGSLEVGNGRYENAGMLTAFVPSRLLPGVYDVSLTLSDRRVGTLYGAFTVDPGLWPAGYSIDPVPSQIHGVPFAITIRATGTNAATFSGTVNYYVPRVSSVITATGPFSGGVRQENVLISNPIVDASINVTDLQGTVARSNNFSVF